MFLGKAMNVARPFLRSLRRCSTTKAPTEKLNLVGVDPMVNPGRKDPQKVFREIVGKIKFGGPITVSQYMQEVLSNPLSGYYMNKDVFGSRGDFTTSPEISQMFGECIAIWFVHEWMKMGSPKPFNIVELGPGRGTLMSDVLRVFRKLVPEAMTETQVHLVEISPKMREMQAKSLEKYSSILHWCHRVEDVPKTFTFFIAHEFFDALPIHKFIKVPVMPRNLDSMEKLPPTDKEWREVLVDVDVDKEKKECLRFVRARHKTPAVDLLPDLSNHTETAIEISPKSGIVVRKVSDRITEFGGIALIADYGRDGPSPDSFRAFRDHKLHDALVDPGTADLTADVDFGYLKSQCREETVCYGPTPQGEFLKSLAIDLRLEKLVQGCDDDKTIRDLKSAYNVLTNKDQMGERFKFLSIFPRVVTPIHEKFPPVGFEVIN